MSVANMTTCTAEADWAQAEAEADLIKRAKRDRKAFAGLYRQHYGAIARYLYRRTGDVHAAEDLVADVFLSAMKLLPRYRYRGVPFRYWLYRIATNAANRWARRRRRHAHQSLSSDPVAPDGAGDPVVINGVSTDQAQRVLLSLAPKHQAVLTLHYLEGLRIEEIAAVLGCRLGTVKSRLSRGRQALRDRLKIRR